MVQSSSIQPIEAGEDASVANAILTERNRRNNGKSLAFFSLCSCHIKLPSIHKLTAFGYASLAGFNGIAVIFISSAMALLIRAAEYSADEDGLTYGLEPSTLIPLGLTITGIFVAFAAPIVGAIVDCTPHRKAILTYSVYGGCLSILCLGMLIRKETWQISWFILVFISPILFTILNTCNGAYLPEIATTAKESVRVSTLSSLCLHGVELLTGVFIAMVGILNSFVDSSTNVNATHTEYNATNQSLNNTVHSNSLEFDHQVENLQIVTLISFVGLFVFAFSSVRRFPEKPSLHKLKEGEKILTFGFKRLGVTMKDIKENYPQLGIFLFAFTFIVGGMNSIVTLSTTFLVSVLDFDASMVPLVFSAALIGALPGCIVAKFLHKKIGFKKTINIILVGIWIPSTALIPVLLKSNKDQMVTYILAFFW